MSDKNAKKFGKNNAEDGASQGGLPNLRGSSVPGAGAVQGLGAPSGGQPSHPASSELSAGLPVCPRHKDRVSYVRCQRCNQPVCPECQRQAAVGVQCVDCVGNQKKSSRKVQTVFGAKVSSRPPIVTYSIMAICIIVYVIQMVLGWENFTVNFAFAPLIGAFEPYRFLTSAFLHSQGSIFHILFNMFALFSIGRILEPAIGWLKFLGIYLVSAIGGSVGYLLLVFDPLSTNSAWTTAVVGASGAVFGLFGAIFLAMRSLGRDVVSILVMVGINLVIGFVVPGIAWQAHLGGLVSGLAIGAIYIYAPAKHRTWLSIFGTVGIFILLVVLAIWKYSSVGLF